MSCCLLILLLVFLSLSCHSPDLLLFQLKRQLIAYLHTHTRGVEEENLLLMLAGSVLAYFTNCAYDMLNVSHAHNAANTRSKSRASQRRAHYQAIVGRLPLPLPLLPPLSGSFCHNSTFIYSNRSTGKNSFP